MGGGIPLKKVEQKDVINFIKEHIIHRFGIPNSIITDQGTMFVRSEVKDFAAYFGIKLHCSSPYYSQANGKQKPLIKTSKRTATRVSPFALAYGHEVVLPMEIMVPSLRIAMQNHLIPETYIDAMITELEDLDDTRMQALNSLMIQK
ncbi:uncharacterized protein [Henckelia pumila]|uniref:uncharacterized protein n=1 Tax=Henckelia pumila TaxID=405737 RepID=UPI003C6E8991